MFNSINSVIESIVKGDARSSLKFLNRFSSLMRLVFESSQNKLVALSAEIEAAANYLDLESIRLKKSISFQRVNNIDISLKEIQIPPLVIQPILENSVWHGLINVKEGDLRIDFEIERKNQNSILLVIRDNGKKPETPKVKKPGKERVSSTVLIKQRLELLSKYYNSSFYMETFELKQGYEVKLTLPLIINEKERNEDYNS
jgi:LytS/YehU family sensor histidine kinase